MMDDGLFIGIDIGTQGTKGIVCTAAGAVLAEAFCPSVLIQPDEITVYEEPENIFSSVLQVIRELTDALGEKSLCVRAVGMDAQMAGIMGVREDFSAVTPLDSWLDSRCAAYTGLIEKQAGDAAVLSSGGQTIHAHAPKILWWKNEQPEAYREIKKFVQPNGYVAGRLCGLCADDAFMDYTFLHFNSFSDNLNCCFNQALLSHFDVSAEKLPRIVSPQEVVGVILPAYAEACGLPRGVKVIAGCGDTAASSLGAGITRTGLAYDVAGTASVFACCTDRFFPDVAHKTVMFARNVCEGLFLPLSYISGGGLCLRWFADVSRLSLKELDGLVHPDEPASTPVFIPHFSGRTFPLDNRVSGAFLELDSTMGAAELYRAILESIAFEYKNYLSILRDTGCVDFSAVVRGVGGGVKSSAFSQIKADVLGLKYTALEKADSAPVAMALLAAHAIGDRAESLQEIFEPSVAAVYEPNADLRRHYERRSMEYLRLLDHYGDYITTIE